MEDIARIQRRFNKYVEPSTTSDCLLWTGASHPRTKHGMFTWSTGRTMSAQRAAWLLAGLELPPRGLVLDHLCNTPPCVNVAHLEPVSYGENFRRYWAHKKTPIL